MWLNEKKRTKIIPIASGKGGVGKTSFTSNLAIALGLRGKKTVVIDLDLGGSNLHTWLGIKNTNLGIGNYLSNPRMKFEELLLDTHYPNLQFIPGDVMVTGMADITFSQQNKIIEQICKLKADYVLIDLGAGSTSIIQDFFLMANSGFIVSSAQMPSIVNSFNFLKNLTFRLILNTVHKSAKAKNLVKRFLRDRAPRTTPSSETIINEVALVDKKLANKIRKDLSTLRPHVLLNMADNPDNIALIEDLSEQCKTNLSIDMQCIGGTFFDDSVNLAIEQGKPTIQLYHDSIYILQVQRIAEKLIASENYPDMPLETDYYSDTFELAYLELRNDNAILEAQKAEGLGQQDLIGVIAEQQKKITELRGMIRNITFSNE